MLSALLIALGSASCSSISLRSCSLYSLARLYCYPPPDEQRRLAQGCSLLGSTKWAARPGWDIRPYNSVLGPKVGSIKGPLRPNIDLLIPYSDPDESLNRPGSGIPTGMEIPRALRAGLGIDCRKKRRTADLPFACALKDDSAPEAAYK